MPPPRGSTAFPTCSERVEHDTAAFQSMYVSSTFDSDSPTRHGLLSMNRTANATRVRERNCDEPKLLFEPFPREHGQDYLKTQVEEEEEMGLTILGLGGEENLS